MKDLLALLSENHRDLVSNKAEDFLSAGHAHDQAIALAVTKASGKSANDLDKLIRGSSGLQAWKRAFIGAYKETGDILKSVLAGEGAINRLRKGLAVKFEDKGAHLVGWGMLFTEPEIRDTDDDYFDKFTQTFLEYYPVAPLWMEHGLDPTYGNYPIGWRDQSMVLEVYQRGIWVEHALHFTDPHYPDTLGMIQRGELFYSSDSADLHLRQDYNGKWKDWPLIGWSLVHKPAEPGLGTVQEVGADGVQSPELDISSIGYKRDSGGQLEIAKKALRSILYPQGGN